MEYLKNIYVIDSIMGSGKTSAIINMINRSDNTEHFLIITPYLTEVERYIKACPKKKFKQPHIYTKTKGSIVSKYDDMKNLLRRGCNIVSTHSLFQRFTPEIINLCQIYGYTLIMDEVAEVIQEWPLTKSDYDILRQEFIDVDEATGKCTWRVDKADYRGLFNDEKIACDNGSLVCYNNAFMVWLFPVEVFNGFENVYILTYKFEAQLQKYYYDYHNVLYTYLGVTGNSLDTYTITTELKQHIKYDYSTLVHILDNNRMNSIGDLQYSLSKTWYEAQEDNSLIDRLQANLINFFINIQHGKISENLWTTFKDYQNKLKGKGYTKGFCPMNMRATNDFRECVNVAYPINRYMQPFIKNFFISNGIQVDEDTWALSEMLQFIWRSAIREGKEITVYVPSKRMRGILRAWIDEVTADYYSQPPKE